MKINIVKQTARRMLISWDYSNLGSVRKYGLTFDLSAAIVKFVVFVFHVLCIATLPFSVFAVIYIGRMSEISNLKSWVKTMRRDKGFFHQHHYIEIKHHIKEHKDSYHLFLNW